MGDSVIVPATKFIFDLHKQDWVDIPTQIRVVHPNKHFEAGGMRVCFEIEEVEEDGGATPCVAKMFKKDIPDVVKIDYFNEGMAQCMSEQFAMNFNKTPTPKKISFLMCNVVRIDPAHVPQRSAGMSRDNFFTFKTQDTREVLFVMEPKFRGKFTKYNNNFGETYEVAKDGGTASQIGRRREVYLAAEAFSHFTLQESGGSMLVCDLQGVEDFFTDPQIHTEDGKGLGMGNMGEEGITKWAEKHRCNEICRQIGLRPLNAASAAPPAMPPPQPVPAPVANPYGQPPQGRPPPQQQMQQPPPPNYGQSMHHPVVERPQQNPYGQPPPQQHQQPLPQQQFRNAYGPPPPLVDNRNNGNAPLAGYPPQQQQPYRAGPPPPMQQQQMQPQAVPVPVNQLGNLPTAQIVNPDGSAPAGPGAPYGQHSYSQQYQQMRTSISRRGVDVTPRQHRSVTQHQQPPPGPPVQQQHPAAYGNNFGAPQQASPTGGAIPPPSGAMKPISEMTEEEQFEYAIQQSMKQR